ncbi:MAG TPA: SDR family oxidoreductase [Planctomycetaceae bacterium]|jgi:nucleoside-diphosphate-sugar epimerase|nr:SDR family oxidoreductase [Planctomycetaceae bacterium]
MRILVTGCYGYIGSLLVPRLLSQRHQVFGLDSGLYRDWEFGDERLLVPCVADDLRDVTRADLVGIDAVIHLAALSNDPLGCVGRELTLDINYRATVRLAELAKQAGVSRFLFASSCSIYGNADGELLDEETPGKPLTSYAESKALAERSLSALANDKFSPTCLRNGTAYGVSSRLRLDLALNEYVAQAVATGRIVVRGGGSAWRPFVHIEDVCRAFEAVLAAPRKVIHNRVFHLGRTEDNCRLAELAELVCQSVPESRVEAGPGTVADRRSCRVECSRLAQEIPGARPRWTLAEGIQQLAEAFRNGGMTCADLDSDRYDRSRALRAHQAAGRLAADLRWRPDIAAARLNAMMEPQPRPTFRATYTSSCARPASSGVRS